MMTISQPRAIVRARSFSQQKEITNARLRRPLGIQSPQCRQEHRPENPRRQGRLLEKRPQTRPHRHAKSCSPTRTATPTTPASKPGSTTTGPPIPDTSPPSNDSCTPKTRLDRCTRHETETTRQRLLHAYDRFDADALAATYELGRRLIDDPFNRAIPPSPVPGDPPPSTTPSPVTINLPKQQRWVDDEPAVLLLQLERSAQGVDWLLARWRELLYILDTELSWNFYYQNRAIRLLGKRVEDLFDDQESRKIILAALAAGKDAQVWGLLDIAKQSMLGAAGRIDDAGRVEYAATLAPATPEEGRDVLRAIVNDEIDRLMRLNREHRLEDIEQMERDGAEARALIDVSHAGVLLRRYETATEREFHKTLAEIQAFRKASAAPIRNEPVPEPARNPQVASTPPPLPPSHPASTDQAPPISAPTIAQVPALPIPRRQ